MLNDGTTTDGGCDHRNRTGGRRGLAPHLRRPLSKRSSQKRGGRQGDLSGTVENISGLVELLRPVRHIGVMSHLDISPSKWDT